MKTIKLLIILILCVYNNLYSQTYIMKTDNGGYGNYAIYESNNGGGYIDYIYEILGKDGKWLKPVKEIWPYLIFDQKPYSFHYNLQIYNDYNLPSSQDRALLWVDDLKDCQNELGFTHIPNDVIIPYFELISNKVIPIPDAQSNQFCDKVALSASGCTGPQKFYWEYSIDGNNFIKTNVVTVFNQKYDFVKASFPVLNNYSGNIFFRALIDWDPSTTEENIYSNIVTYKISSCSPDLTHTSNPNYTTCNYSEGEVIFTFSRPLETNEKFIFSRNLEGTDLFYSSSSKDVDVEKISEKIYKWKNIPAGKYNFSFQTQFGENNPSELVKNLSFSILPKEKLISEITIIQPPCNSDLGKIQISAKGGNPPYYYYFGHETANDKHPLVSNPFIVPTDLSEGNHKITVIDSSFCIEKR